MAKLIYSTTFKKNPTKTDIKEIIIRGFILLITAIITIFSPH